MKAVLEGGFVALGLVSFSFLLAVSTKESIYLLKRGMLQVHQMRLKKTVAYLLGGILALSLLALWRGFSVIFLALMIPPSTWVTSLGIRFYLDAKTQRLANLQLTQIFISTRELLRIGHTLPEALARSTQNTDHAWFKNKMSNSLDRVTQGKSLSSSFKILSAHRAFGAVSSFWEVLELAYREGLSCLPIVDILIETLDHKRKLTEKIADCRNSAIFQILIATLVPWILGAVMQSQLGGIHPWENPYHLAFLILGIIWEVLGVVALVRLCRFT